MSIQVKCPRCKRVSAVGESASGKSIKCGCGAIIAVEVEATEEVSKPQTPSGKPARPLVKKSTALRGNENGSPSHAPQRKSKNGRREKQNSSLSVTMLSGFALIALGIGGYFAFSRGGASTSSAEGRNQHGESPPPQSPQGPSTSKPPEKSSTGKVSIEVSWKFNNALGNRADAGATVILIPKTSPQKIKIESLETILDDTREKLAHQGAYAANVGASGFAKFSKVMVGEYTALLISKNTSTVAGAANLALLKKLLEPESEMGRLAIEIVANRRIGTISISVSANDETESSYDFGYTDF